MLGLTAQINTSLDQSSVSKLKNDLQNQISSINGRINITANATQLEKLNTQLKNLRNSSLQVDKIMRDLDRTVGRVDKSISDTANGIIKMRSNTSDLTKVFSEANTTLEAFAQQTGLAARRFLAFSVAFAGIAGLAGAVKGAVAEAVTFDKELVRIGQVSEDSFDKVRNLGKEVGRLSTTLGVNSTELLKSAVLLKQAGLSVKDTTVALEALAKASLAPNFDSLSDTTEGLIAIMQQFKVEAKDFESALGSMNTVAGAFAVEAGDLTKVVQKAGGVFAAIKGDSKPGRDALNELLALFTSIRSTTRESADEIGTGLRTIFGRLQRTETVEALKALGVQIRYTREEIQSGGLDQALEGQFVGGYEAIRRISLALNQIPSTDARFAAIAEQIGGLRQLSRVIPLVKEFSKSQEALAVAQAGSNSLAINAMQAQESLANKIDKVKEKWLELGRTITDSGGFKDAFFGISTLSDGLVGLLKTLTPLIPILGAIAGGKLIQTFAPAIAGAILKREQYPGYNDSLKAIRENKGDDPRKKYTEMYKDNTPLSQVPKHLRPQLTKDLRKTIADKVQEFNPNFTPSQIKAATDAEIKNIINDRKESEKLKRQSIGLESAAGTKLDEANILKGSRNSLNQYVQKSPLRDTFRQDSDILMDDLGRRKTKLQNLTGQGILDSLTKNLNSRNNSLIGDGNKLKNQVAKQSNFATFQDFEAEYQQTQADLAKAQKNKKATKPFKDKLKILDVIKNDLDLVDQNTNQAINKMNTDFQNKPMVQAMKSMVAAGRGGELIDPRTQGRIDELTRQREYVKDPEAFKEKEKVLRAESEKSSLEAGLAKTKADGIGERQVIVTTVDALGKTTNEMPSSTDRLKKRADSTAPQTGATTIKGFIQAEAERTIVMENIVADDLKKLAFAKTEGNVREQFIRGMQFKIQEQDKSIKAEHARILAEQQFAEALEANSLILTQNYSRKATPIGIGGYLGGAKGTIVDADQGLGTPLTDQSVRSTMIKNLLTKENVKGVSALGLPILSGLISSNIGDATTNVKSGNTASFGASKGLEGAAMLGGGLALIGAGPVGIAIGATVGFSNAIIQAKKEIEEAHLGIAVQQVADKFRQISENLISLDLSTAKDIMNSQRVIGEKSFASAQGNNILSTLGYQFGVGSGSGFMSEGTEKYRAELSKNSAQTIQQFTKEIEREMKASPRGVNESDKEFSDRIFKQSLGNNEGFFKSQFNNMAFSEKIDISKINQRGMSQVTAAMEVQKNQKAMTKTNEIVNNFGLLADSVISANMELRKFADAASDFANVLNGKADFVKVQSLSDAVKSSSAFNTSTFQDVLGSVGGQLPGALGQANVIGAARQMLPVIVSTIRATGNMTGEGGFSGAITTQLSDQLKAKGFGKEDVSSVVSGIATSLANVDMTKLFVDSGNDVTKVTDKLLDPVSKPFIDMLTSVRKELETSANTFIAQLNNVGQAALKLNEDLSVVDRNRSNLARTEAEVTGRLSGKLPQDVLPLPNLADKAMQRMAGGMNINDPAAIGKTIEENIKKLSTFNNVSNNAMKGGFAQGSEFDKTTREFVELQNETNRYMAVLKQLSDASQKLAELQEKINHLKDEESAKFSQARIELAGSPEQRRELRRGKEVFDRVEKGEKISSLSRREAARLFSFSDGAGPRAKEVVNAALRREGKGLNPKDEAEMQKLLKDQADAQKRAVEAAEAVATNTESLSKILKDQVIASQNSLVAALDRNTRMIEMTKVGTQLGQVSSQIDSLKGPNEALKNIAAVFALNPNVEQSSNDSIISNRNLISSFGSIKNKKEIQDFFSVGGVENDPNKVAGIQKDIVDTATGDNFIQKRESMIQKMMSQFGFERTVAEGLVPQESTGNTAGKIFGRTADYLNKNPLFDQKEFEKRKNDMNAKGLGGITGLSPAEIGNIAKNAEAFSKYNMSVSELEKKTKDLTTQFDALSTLLKGLNAASSSGASGAAGAAVAGMAGVLAKPFAGGGPVFRQQGMDKVPAMLQPGELVLKKDEVAQRNNPNSPYYRPNLNASIDQAKNKILEKNFSRHVFMARLAGQKINDDAIYSMTIEGERPVKGENLIPRIPRIPLLPKDERPNDSTVANAPRPIGNNRPMAIPNGPVPDNMFNRLYKNAPMGDPRRFYLSSQTADPVKNFGSDLYNTRRKSFNTSAYMSSINQTGRPGVGGQRAMEASLMASAVASNIGMAMDKYGDTKASKDYRNVFKNPLRFAEGGVVPGFGFGDKVPSMLTPGEVVLNRKQQNQLTQSAQPKVQSLDESGKKFSDSIKMMEQSIVNFGKHVDVLDKALDKKVSFDGEHLVTVNITGIPKESDNSRNIEEVVMAAVQKQLKESFPGFV